MGLAERNIWRVKYDDDSFSQSQRSFYSFILTTGSLESVSANLSINDITCPVTKIKCTKSISTIAHQMSHTSQRGSFRSERLCSSFKQNHPFKKFAIFPPPDTHNWRSHFEPAPHLGRRLGTAQSALHINGILAISW